MGGIAVKKLWLRVHVWMGLFLGLLFVFEGLTGSLLVFHRAIDTWLNQTLLELSAPIEARSLDELLAALHSAATDLPAPTHLDLPQTRTDVVHAWYHLHTQSGERRKLEVLLDPGSGKILGSREYGTHLTSIIYGLHREWLSGNAGEALVGFVGITLVCSIGTGLYLWRPKPGQLLWAFRPGRTVSVLQRHYYRHKTAGISGAVVLVLVACSGIFIEFHEWLIPVIRLLSPVQDKEPMVLSRQDYDGESISAQQAIGLARQRFPHAEVKYVMLPDGLAGVYVVGVRQPDEVLKTGGSSGVWIDQYSGDFLAVRDWSFFTAGETFLAWQFPLHNGEAFGLAGRWIVFFSGFVPLVLYVTALRMWWLKRLAHRRQKECEAGGPGGLSAGTEQEPLGPVSP